MFRYVKYGNQLNVTLENGENEKQGKEISKKVDQKKNCPENSHLRNIPNLPKFFKMPVRKKSFFFFPVQPEN